MAGLLLNSIINPGGILVNGQAALSSAINISSFTIPSGDYGASFNIYNVNLYAIGWKVWYNGVDVTDTVCRDKVDKGVFSMTKPSEFRVDGTPGYRISSPETLFTQSPVNIKFPLIFEKVNAAATSFTSPISPYFVFMKYSEPYYTVESGMGTNYIMDVYRNGQLSITQTAYVQTIPVANIGDKFTFNLRQIL